MSVSVAAEMGTRAQTGRALEPAALACAQSGAAPETDASIMFHLLPVMAREVNAAETCGFVCRTIGGPVMSVARMGW